MTPEQLQQIDSLFDHLDLDRDGLIRASEITYMQHTFRLECVLRKLMLVKSVVDWRTKCSANLKLMLNCPRLLRRLECVLHTQLLGETVASWKLRRASDFKFMEALVNTSKFVILHRLTGVVNLWKTQWAAAHNRTMSLRGNLPEGPSHRGQSRAKRLKALARQRNENPPPAAKPLSSAGKDVLAETAPVELAAVFSTWQQLCRLFVLSTSTEGFFIKVIIPFVTYKMRSTFSAWRKVYAGQVQDGLWSGGIQKFQHWRLCKAFGAWSQHIRATNERTRTQSTHIHKKGFSSERLTFAQRWQQMNN